MTQAEQLQLKNMAEQVLHVPGNYRGGILEMAMVFDCGLKPEELNELAVDAAGALKSKGGVFRNVRLNAVRWQDDAAIGTETTSLPCLQMGRYFERYRQQPADKALDVLAAYLKLYQARAKLILLFTGGRYHVADEAALESSMKPFLGRKLIFLTLQEGRLSITRGRPEGKRIT